MEEKKEGCDVYGFHPRQDERVGVGPQGQDLDRREGIPAAGRKRQQSQAKQALAW